MNDNNNGLNQFNKRQIESRNGRARRRTFQRIAVLVLFILLVAILATVLVLVIADIGENIATRLPQNDDPIKTDPNGQTMVTTPTDSGTSGSEDPDSTTPSETTPSQTDEVTTAGNSGYKYVYYTKAQMYQGSLILVNEDHPFVEPADMASQVERIANYRPSESKSLYFLATNVKLLPRVSQQLYKMSDANFADTKINDLCISTNGAYRTNEEQQALFDGGYDSFPGGCSDFNTGLSVYFIGYPAPGQYPALDSSSYPSGAVIANWLEKYSYRYGFIKRFTASKQVITGHSEDVGHYRYVGYVHAYNMVQNNLCLEEYINMISRYTFLGQHYKVIADDGHSYEIYYVASTGDITDVPVPESLPYEVSGDNYSGYIVTVTLN